MQKQHYVHDTERRQTKEEHNTVKSKKISNKHPEKPGIAQELVKGKQFSFLIRHEPCYL